MLWDYFLLVSDTNRYAYISQNASERKCRPRDAYKAASLTAEVDQCVAGWTCRGSDGTSAEKWRVVQDFRLNCIPSRTGLQPAARSHYVTAGSSPLQKRDFSFFKKNKSLLFDSKNGSGEVGAKVDPAVSSECRGAPSQTRLDFSGRGKAAARWDGEICSYRGEITGAAVKEITELPLWPKNCVSRRPLCISAGFLPAEDTGDFPENCCIGRLLLFFCMLFLSAKNSPQFMQLHRMSR